MRYVGVKAVSVLVCGLVVACAAPARQLVATPADVTQVLASATGGDTVILRGTFPQVRIWASYNSPMTVDASGAVMRSLEISGRNIVVRGGTVDTGDLNSWRAVTIRDSRGVRLESVRITRSQVGLLVLSSSDVRIGGNLFEGLRSDGMQIVGSQRVLVEYNRCRDPRSIPAVYDSAGRMVKDGDHPDCIQLWSVPGSHGSDIVIANNRIEGGFQGIFMNGQDGDKSGLDRVTIENNYIRNTYWWGIALSNIRDSKIRFNDVAAIPGTVRNPGGLVTSRISIEGGRNQVCGNKLAKENGSTAGATRTC